MGRPRKDVDQLTIEDFEQYYDLKRHDWLAEKKMNAYVNAALGIDIFSTEVWPLQYERAAGRIYLRGLQQEHSWKENQFDFAEAKELMEVWLNDSKHS